MTAPLVILVVGNPSRGDDAIGPLLCGRLVAWLDTEGIAANIELVEDFQLQIEHVLDLKGRAIALFVDAGERTPAPYTLTRIAPAPTFAHTTHQLSPEALLQVFRQTEGSEPPPSFVLCVQGVEFGLGEPLTATATRNAEAAFEQLKMLCRDPALSSWQRATDVHSPGAD
jgi:hydrogenase maturation protease